MTILKNIGKTRLIPLKNIVPAGSAMILIKLEYENPAGSMKDRMVLAMIEAAEADGRLRPDSLVVEYSGGSRPTGGSALSSKALAPPLHCEESPHVCAFITKKGMSSQSNPKNRLCC